MNKRESSLDETILLPKNANTTPRRVGFVEGSNWDLSSEIQPLLHERLRYVSILFFAGFFSFFVLNLFLDKSPTTGSSALFILHVVVMFVTGFFARRLCVNCRYVDKNLRLAELLVFGAPALMFAALTYFVTIQSVIQDGYMTSVSAPWILLVFTYALFIPNSWQRAASVIFPIVLTPVLIVLFVRMTSPEFADVIAEYPKFRGIVVQMGLEMLLTATIATWGVRSIRTLRREALESKRLGNYHLKQLLGSGGMGEVYIGEHILLKRPCAIKLIRSERAGDPQTLARFEREVQSMARLTHWHTVDIYDYGRSDDGTFYYVMEYLPGLNLNEIVELDGPLPANRVIHFLLQTCEALSEAHRIGLIHRDIKPANIFSAKRGDHYDVTKLLDFGLVRSDAHSNDAMLTQDQTVIGSPMYMSPEQASGRELDHRSDIYSLGATAYTLLTGETPFQGETPIQVIVAQASGSPREFSELGVDVPDDLANVVRKCMARDASDRYANVRELKYDLQACHDAESWSTEMAEDWWRAKGCPKKKALDQMVYDGMCGVASPKNVLETQELAAV